MTPKDYTRYFFILFSLLVIFLVYLIVKPFLIAILSAFVMAYIFYPVYSWINRKFKNDNLSAGLSILLIMIVVLVPFAILLVSIANDLPGTYGSWKRYTTGAVFNDLCGVQPDHAVCSIYSSIRGVITNERFGFSTATIESITNTINKNIFSFVFSLPRRILDAFIILFVTFFLFKDAKLLMDKVRRVLPLKESHKGRLLKTLYDVTSATIYGQLLVALIQGIAAGIGYAIFGIDNFVIFGTLTFFAALIPIVGTGLIWGPIVFMKIMTGYLTNAQGEVLSGTLLLIYSLIFVAWMDNILRPKIIGKRANIHPAVVLLGVLGGIRVFGIIGVIIGPVLLAIFLNLIKIYEIEKNSLKG